MISYHISILFDYFVDKVNVKLTIKKNNITKQVYLKIKIKKSDKD